MQFLLDAPSNCASRLNAHIVRPFARRTSYVFLLLRVCFLPVIYVLLLLLLHIPGIFESIAPFQAKPPPQS